MTNVKKVCQMAAKKIIYYMRLHVTWDAMQLYNRG